tara:strand:- start:1068 stop:1250 length:183 start_codon:yes stop_codon:yes gene_type:complete
MTCKECKTSDTGHCYSLGNDHYYECHNCGHTWLGARHIDMDAILYTDAYLNFALTGDDTL